MDIQEMAKNAGCESAVYLGQWEGFNVYLCMEEGDIETGWPLYFLEKDGKVRENTSEEVYELMDRFPSGPAYFPEDVKRLASFLTTGKQ